MGNLKENLLFKDIKRSSGGCESGREREREKE